MVLVHFSDVLASVVLVQRNYTRSMKMIQVFFFFFFNKKPSGTHSGEYIVWSSLAARTKGNLAVLLPIKSPVLNVRVNEGLPQY